MYNIETLAKLAGLTRRTIRYYVQRGLLDPPEGGGRGSYYTEEHLRKIEKIQKWAEQGVPLIHMKAMLEGRKAPEQVDRPTGIRTTTWERSSLMDGVELAYRPGLLSYEDLFQVKTLIQDLMRRKNDADQRNRVD
jgi:DNA-binding transcriptional MerR regulator